MSMARYVCSQPVAHKRVSPKFKPKPADSYERRTPKLHVHRNEISTWNTQICRHTRPHLLPSHTRRATNGPRKDPHYRTSSHALAKTPSRSPQPDALSG